MISEYNQMLIELGISLGWNVDSSKVNQTGLRFEKDNFAIWKSAYCGIHWRRCEYINGYAANHKSYDTCEEALQDVCITDSTKGLSNHNLKEGQICKYLSDNKKTLGSFDCEPIYSNCKVLSAFGEKCQFILIETDDGKTLAVANYDLRIF